MNSQSTFITPELVRIYQAPAGEAAGDVIFVHGLGGDPLETWGINEKSSWKQWLEKNRPDLNVWSLKYAVEATEWTGDSMPLSDRALNILALMDNYGLGERPVAFVCHSMGGLLVKEMLRHALTTTVRYKHVVEKTRAIVFFATPHAGSNVSYYAQYLSFFVKPTVSVREMQTNHSNLRNLNLWFRNNFNELKLHTCIFYESSDTLGVRVVDETSADPGIPQCSPIRIDGDHVTVAKPRSYKGVAVGQTLKTIDVAIPHPINRFNVSHPFEDLPPYGPSNSATPAALNESTLRRLWGLISKSASLLVPPLRPSVVVALYAVIAFILLTLAEYLPTPSFVDLVVVGVGVGFSLRYFHRLKWLGCAAGISLLILAQIASDWVRGNISENVFAHIFHHEFLTSAGAAVVGVALAEIFLRVSARRRRG